MSKYSIQNECLEMIEAFSDEQIDREMAVIESVLDIFDKTILMMELSNNDVDIPDCSMFMESTFFQEDETPTENSQTANDGEGGEVAQSEPAAQDGQQQNNGQSENNGQNANNDSQNKSGKGEKVTNNPEEYNKDHHFRKANKEGKLENIFISIIMFIPRLLSLPIKLLINFIKKKKNDKATENAKKATPEEKAKVAEELKKNEGSNEGDVKIENGALTASATVTGNGSEEQVWMVVDSDANIGINIDLNATGNGILDATSLFVQQYSDPKQALTSSQPISFDFKSVKQRMDDANRAHAERRQKDTIEAFEGKRSQVLQALENRLNELRQSETNLENCIKIFEAPNALKGYDLQQVVNARKTDLNNIKEIIKIINNKIQELSAIDALTNEIFNVYNGYLTKAKQISNAVNNAVTADNTALNQDKADVKAGQTPSQGFHINPVIQKTNGGENNGGQNQNNQSNAG